MNNNRVIAIDGYAACGKSVLAKALAGKLNFTYIDSGAMYRAVTLYCLRNNIACNQQGPIIEALKNVHLSFSMDSKLILLNQEDVSTAIRHPSVSEQVSTIAALQGVRSVLLQQQKAMGQSKNIVMDGRDIGTVVFPNAQFKFFLTADPAVRAQRRFKELNDQGVAATFREVLRNIIDRDHQDMTRTASPLKRVADAIALDNTYLSQAEQLDFALKIINPC